MDSRKNKELGQGLLEYVLLIAIVVAIIGGVVYKFNAAVRQSLAGYFGENGYLECLVKSGELPFSGGTCEDVRARTKMPPYQSMKSPIGTSNSTSPLAISASANADAKGKAASEAGGDRSVPATSSDFGGRGGTFGGRNSSLGGEDGASKSAKADAPYTGSDKFSTSVPVGPAGSSGESSDSRLRPRYVEDSYLSSSVDSLAAKDRNVPATERDLKARGKFVSAESAKRKLALEESANASFGALFKYFLIALIVLAVFFFIGSQLYFISKGSKGGAS